MSQKAYISDICKRWPLNEQLAAIKAAGIGSVYQDELNLKRGQYLKPDLLTERAILLKPSSRNGNTTIVVQSLGVLACNTEDLMNVLDLAAERGAAIYDLSANFTIGPRPNAATQRQAIKVFEQAKQADKNLSRGQAGGIKSGKVRKARIAAAIDLIRARWPNPDYETSDLLKEAKLPYNTAANRLGRRPLEIAYFLAAQKRKDKRDAKGI